MDLEITPGKLSGTINICSSKSVLHRQIICASLSDGKTEIYYNGLPDDVKATLDCVGKTLCDHSADGKKITIFPKNKKIQNAKAECGGSASTLRFLLPVFSALGTECTFLLDDSLSKRPHKDLTDLLNEHGASIRCEENTVKISGKIKSGTYKIDGSISSQYISGLMFALPLLDSDSTVIIENGVVSYPYINLTKNILESFGVKCEIKDGKIKIQGNQRYISNGTVFAEGDYSSGAALLVSGAFSEKGLTVKGLSLDSKQGDKAICDILRKAGADIEQNQNSVFVKKNQLNCFSADLTDTPDLFPTMAVLAAFCRGESELCGISRLSFKESDRVKEVGRLLDLLNVSYDLRDEKMYIQGIEKSKGGFSFGSHDHRMIEAAAVSSCMCVDRVSLKNAGCVSKSYVDFFGDFERLNGKVKEIG